MAVHFSFIKSEYNKNLNTNMHSKKHVAEFVLFNTKNRETGLLLSMDLGIHIYFTK